jgi:hypothetical protein
LGRERRREDKARGSKDLQVQIFGRQRDMSIPKNMIGFFSYNPGNEISLLLTGRIDRQAWYLPSYSGAVLLV